MEVMAVEWQLIVKSIAAATNFFQFFYFVVIRTVTRLAITAYQL